MSTDAEQDNSTTAKSESPSSDSKGSPNLTLLETGQNPGAILKSAREKLGLEVSELSTKTKINANQILAIEAGDLDRLPPATFAKAFIKSYCKVVCVEPEPILLAYGFQPQSHEKKGGKSVDRMAPNLEPRMPKNSRRLSSLSFDRRPGSKRAGTVIVLLAAALFAMVYLPEFLADSEPDLGQQTAEPVAPDLISSEPPVSAAAPTERSIQTLPSQPGVVRESLPLAIDPVGDSGSAGTLGSVFPAIRDEQQKAALADSDASARGTTEAVDSEASGTATEQEASAQEPAAADSVTSPTVAAAKPGESTLQFVFDDESWVTVRDARDRVLMSKLNQAGQQASVQGKAPFTLIVGKAQAVTLLHDGEPVDLAPHIRGEVARLTVQ